MLAIPNDDAPYEDSDEPLSWLYILAAIHHESGGSAEGCNIAEEWSLQSGKHNSHADAPNQFENTWNSFKADHPNPRTARSLISLAREHNPDFWTAREIEGVDDALDDAADDALSDAGAAKPEPTKRHRILIVAGEHPRVVDESEAALIAAGVPFYPRSDKIVRPIVDIVPAHGEGATTTIARLHPISVDALVDTLARVASYQQYDGRAKKVLITNPPRIIAQQYLARVGEWKLPRLAGIITTPTLRPDGSILATEGYDAATALLLVNPPDMPAMPDKPTRAHALAALTLLKGVLAEFKFTDEASRAVALSGMLTPLVRGAVPVAPLHASSAPSFGSGKSYLWDVCGALSIGARCPVIAAGRNDEETEKRLSSILMTGQPIISIDNVSDALGGDFLAQAISQPRLQVRILGKSETPEVESRTTIYASGINLRVRADMVRRTIRAAMDMEEERPELHEYAGNPFKAILAERGRYLAAGLTVVRAYIVAGRPGLPSPLNGFEEWSATVRAALLWLDCADPIATIEESRIDDPETEQLRAVVSAWRVIAKDSERLTSTQMLGRDGDDLTEAVQTLPGLTSDSVKLGNWLKGKKGRIIDDIAIRGDYNTHKKVWEWHWHELNPL